MGRAQVSFAKRQREQAKRERQQLKAARRAERKNEPKAADGSEIETIETDETSEPVDVTAEA